MTATDPGPRPGSVRVRRVASPAMSTPAPTDPEALAPSPDSILLTGRCALVTGAARGIGKASALALARFGADVAVCDRLGDELAGDEQRVPSFPEDDYANSAKAGERTLEDLINELRSTHESAKTLFQSFPDEVLLRTGEGFKGPYSVASIGFIIPGHQRWHFDVIKEKYLTLV